MDQKSKLQKKKPSGSMDLQTKQAEREKILLLERSMQELKDQLLTAQTESDAKDELLANQAEVAQEAVSGWQKAESEISSLKQQLKNLVHQKSQTEQNYAKLRENVQISPETKNGISVQEEIIKHLEEKLTEANDKVSILTIENNNLYAILETKETIIKEMNESSDKASVTEMKVRLDTTEKENSNLKYELHMVQKELEIRNKERDYNIKTAEAAYKQQMESLKKISKLETECNKLRIMVRKRLPGPGAIAKMRNEIKSFGLTNSGTETRRKMPSPLMEKLHVIEEENRVLKETLARKNVEDSMSCATESWATALIAELEHFKDEKPEGPNSDFGFEEDQFQNYPSWLKDIVRVIIKKHYVVQMSVNSIIEEVLVALKMTGFYTEEGKGVKSCTVAPENTEIPDKFSEVPDRSDLCTNEENGFPKETCKSAPNMEITAKPFEEDESQGSNDPYLDANEKTNRENIGIERECDNVVEREIGERYDKLKLENKRKKENESSRTDELELDAFKDVKKSFEFESVLKLESDNTNGEGKQLESDPAIVEASKKLAECQEAMLNLSKQLQTMSEKNNTSISDKKGISSTTPKSSRRSFSLYQILAEESKQLESSNKNDEVLATEQENGADLMIKSCENDMRVQLMASKRQKEGSGLLSRIFFGRKKKERKLERET